MKIVFLLLVLGSVGALADSKPLITKSNGGGVTPSDSSRSEVCEVYLDKVLITKRYYFADVWFEVKEEKEVSLSKGIHMALQNALNEKVEEKENGLCDVPITYIRMGDAVLFSSGGCSLPRLNRVGPFSDAIRDVVNNFCPTTFDYDRKQ